MPYKDPEAQRQYQREWVARRRTEYFAGKSCVECGATEDLRLDHIDPTQKVDHKIWSWSAARREAELTKCQVLCEPCHQEKTANDMGYHQHGTVGRYRNPKIKCRCKACTAANTQAQQRQRAKVPQAGIEPARTAF
ncbi:HNH endonuclease [Mycobacterium phage Lukilu]|uniref:HNH endonuclease n=1 Tax=Mycobacterium phage Lukilu TaxID=1913044 RepID=A0A1J0M9R5_9CAUD|nr:HNH endonuclease [Mycobacterium phage Lukilu]APD17116.1 HNH endonuclease [Mycobacterium phage Lukilu]